MAKLKHLGFNGTAVIGRVQEQSEGLGRSCSEAGATATHLNWLHLSHGSLRALDLEALIAEKKRMGRSKDSAAVELLEQVLHHRNSQD